MNRSVGPSLCQWHQFIKRLETESPNMTDNGRCDIVDNPSMTSTNERSWRLLEFRLNKVYTQLLRRNQRMERGRRYNRKIWIDWPLTHLRAGEKTPQTVHCPAQSVHHFNRCKRAVFKHLRLHWEQYYSLVVATCNQMLQNIIYYVTVPTKLTSMPVRPCN